MLMLIAMAALCSAGICGMLMQPGAAAPGWILFVACAFFVLAAIAGALPQ